MADFKSVWQRIKCWLGYHADSEGRWEGHGYCPACQKWHPEPQSDKDK